MILVFSSRHIIFWHMMHMFNQTANQPIWVDFTNSAQWREHVNPPNTIIENEPDLFSLVENMAFFNSRRWIKSEYGFYLPEKFMLVNIDQVLDYCVDNLYFCALTLNLTIKLNYNQQLLWIVFWRADVLPNGSIEWPFVNFFH